VDYGTGKVGSGGFTPDMSFTGGYPAIGSTTFAPRVKKAVGGAGGVMFFGLTSVSIPALGGTLLVLPTLGIPIATNGVPGTPGAGAGSLTLPIPNNPLIIGLHLFFQCFLLDAGAASGISISNGLDATVCQ
jgi:hypothetical protein